MEERAHVKTVLLSPITLNGEIFRSIVPVRLERGARTQLTAFHGLLPSSHGLAEWNRRAPVVGCWIVAIPPIDTLGILRLPPDNQEKSVFLRLALPDLLRKRPRRLSSAAWRANRAWS